MIVIVVISIILVLATYLCAIKQRGNHSYFVAVAYTAASFIVFFSSFLFIEGLNVGASAPNSFNSFLDGAVRVSFMFFPATLLITCILYVIALKLGSKEAQAGIENNKIEPKKWILYVLLNGIVVNGILFIYFSIGEKMNIFIFLLSTLLLILHYPILCKMNRWMKKALVLAGTMIIYFPICMLILDKTPNNIDDIKSIPLIGFFAFMGGSVFLMTIFWMNYALRKQLF